MTTHADKAESQRAGTSSAMVVRIRDALRFECLQIFGSTWNNDNAERLARAAIGAMRHSSGEMNKRGADVALHIFEDAISQGEIAYLWQNMIDAALGGKGEG